MVKSSRGVTPKPRFGPNLDSTVDGGPLDWSSASSLGQLELEGPTEWPAVYK